MSPIFHLLEDQVLDSHVNHLIRSAACIPCNHDIGSISLRWAILAKELIIFWAPYVGILVDVFFQSPNSRNVLHYCRLGTLCGRDIGVWTMQPSEEPQ